MASNSLIATLPSLQSTKVSGDHILITEKWRQNFFPHKASIQLPSAASPTPTTVPLQILWLQPCNRKIMIYLQCTDVTTAPSWWGTAWQCCKKRIEQVTICLWLLWVKHTWCNSHIVASSRSHSLLLLTRGLQTWPVQCSWPGRQPGSVWWPRGCWGTETKCVFQHNGGTNMWCGPVVKAVTLQKRPGTFSVVCHLAINATNLLSGTVYSYIMPEGTHPQPNMATSKETSLYQLWQHNGSPSPTGSLESTQEMPTETRDWDIDLFIWTYNLLAKVSPL